MPEKITNTNKYNLFDLSCFWLLSTTQCRCTFAPRNPAKARDGLSWEAQETSILTASTDTQSAGDCATAGSEDLAADMAPAKKKIAKRSNRTPRSIHR